MKDEMIDLEHQLDKILMMIPEEHQTAVRESFMHHHQVLLQVHKKEGNFADDIKEMADKAIEDFIRQIPSIIQRSLKGLLFAGMGFENRWDDLEVRREDNVINRWIKEEAEEAVQKQLKDGVNVDITKRMENAVRKRFAEVYREVLMRRVEQIAEEAATHDAEAFLHKLVPKVKEIQLNLSPSKEDIHDPNYGRLYIERRILGEIAKEDEEE
jgi:hypothetical protein